MRASSGTPAICGLSFLRSNDFFRAASSAFWDDIPAGCVSAHLIWVFATTAAPAYLCPSWMRLLPLVNPVTPASIWAVIQSPIQWGQGPSAGQLRSYPGGIQGERLAMSHSSIIFIQEVNWSSTNQVRTDRPSLSIQSGTYQLSPVSLIVHQLISHLTGDRKLLPVTGQPVMSCQSVNPLMINK